MRHEALPEVVCLHTLGGGGALRGEGLYIWAIPPKLAPVSENTVFAHFANIIKQINKYSYLNHHFS